MRVFATTVLFALSAFAYQVTSPGDSVGWTDVGPNVLTWQRVDTDPLNFTVVLTNQNTQYSEILDSNVDGTLGSVICSTPAGGWPTGSTFRVNLAQDAQHLNSLLAQSNQFNITASSPSASASASAVSVVSASGSPSAQSSTASAARVSSSATSTTPTGTSAASLGADAHAGLFIAVAALTAIMTTLF